MAALAGVSLPIAPRRGFVLVTEPLPQLVRHKVYLADYVADVASDSAALQSSPVVEGTPSGTVLIGATRERVGFDRTLIAGRGPGAGRRCRAAVSLSGAGVGAARLPRVPPVLPRPPAGHRSRYAGARAVARGGHEGAGIGLAPATGHLIARALTGAATELPLGAFRPERFDTAA